MLDAITPVVLTRNEADNVPRLLAGLGWARRIVVVDSGSDDATLELLAADPRVTVFHRSFDNHWNQWTYAMAETGIDSDWVLRLDADYVVTGALVAELAALSPDAPVDAYRLRFRYAMWGRVLPGSLYPPNHILFRRGRARVVARGHTEGWEVDGPVAALRNPVIHDDRKPMRGFILSQIRYMEHEADAVEAGKPGLSSWLRRHPPLMPLFVLAYCLIAKGLVFAGPAGWMYTLQRVTAEAILSLILFERRFRRR